MAKYTIRVELHGASEDDYTTLHDAMRESGFSRFIRSSDGKLYHLPSAEYNIDTQRSRSEVLELAKDAGNSTGCTFEALVTESAGRTWHNLTPAK